MTVKEAADALELEGQRISKEDLKSSYRKLILRWHPDRHSGDEAVRYATAIAQKVNLAYEVLARSLEDSAFIVNPSKMDSTSDNESPRRQRYGKTRSEPKASRPRIEVSSRRRFWHDVVEHGFPDETVFEVFFESSHLVSAGYDPITRTLYQKFMGYSGGIVVYRYFDVPISVWNELLAAPSKGSFAYRNINYSYRYERCVEPNRPYNPKWRFAEGEHPELPMGL